jgi:hypothetical protein
MTSRLPWLLRLATSIAAQERRKPKNSRYKAKLKSMNMVMSQQEPYVLIEAFPKTKPQLISRSLQHHSIENDFWKM